MAGVDASQSRSEIGDHRRHLGSEQLDAAEQVGVRQPRVRHLDGDAADTAELLGHTSELGGDGIWVAHEKRPVGPTGGIELGSGRRWEATFT